ncbi:hypothetical protein QO004_000826 [Rhizobium mesoamericanum]|nr:hypothetical protein [Rhizobium mesoamericanum]MDQ0559048.1 hypothetical protein [Rhizobium mesoamericanum]
MNTPQRTTWSCSAADEIAALKAAIEDRFLDIGSKVTNGELKWG